jgi:hypothetical protein
LNGRNVSKQRKPSGFTSDVITAEAKETMEARKGTRMAG